MREASLKFISVACALIMVLTAFQVMTTNVSAEDIDDEIAESDPSTHDHRQLTISNEGATSPASTTSSNGTLHVAWVDIISSGVELCYKRSYDNGTYFSSDLVITTVFHSITNISISCSNDLDVGIAFEGCLNANSNTTVYLLCSSDGGLSWSQAYQLCEGSSPSVFAGDELLYLGLTRPYNGSFVFSILNFTIDDNAVVNSASMISLSIGEGFGTIIGDGSEIYYAIRSSDGITYGSIDYDGQQVDTSRSLRSIYAGNVSDLDMTINDGRLFIVWSLNGETEAYIHGLVSSSAHQSWTAVTISSTEGYFGSVSVTACGTGFFVAWENDTKAWTEISASRLSSGGTIIGDTMRLSTDRVESSRPSATTDANGEISCIWSEAHYQTTELFFFQDVLFETLDIYSMKEYVASLDDAIFTSSTARSDMLASIELIMERIANADDEGALTEIGTLMSKVDGFMGGATGNDLIDSTSVQIRIYDVLDPLRETLSYGESTTGMAISNLAATCSSSSATITWTTSSDATSVVEYGTTASYGNIVTGVSGTSHSVTITGLSASTTYYYKVRSMSTADPSYTASSVSTLTTNESLSILIDRGVISNAIHISSSSILIEWTTTVNSTSLVEYGTTSSYGSTTTGTSGTSHSVTLTGLMAATQYHYRVRSASLENSSETVSGDDANFTTGAAEVTSVTVTVISSSSVTIAWTTASSCTSEVNYGLTSSYGSTATGTSGTSHSVMLTGLLAATAYHYRVRSTSLTNSTDVDCSADGSFTTGAAEITSVTVTVSSSSVTITWTTSSTRTTVVEYGTTSSYGSTKTGTSGTSHSVTITGLYPSTTYHFRAMSVSTSSTYYSTDRTFTASSSAISNMVISIGSASTVITWTTSFSSGTSVVEYGTTSSYGSSVTGTTSGTSHSVTLTGLSSSTTYYFRAKSMYGLYTYYSVETTFFEPAITITDICLTSISSSSVTITWTTSISGTSVVDYGTASSYGSTATGTSGTSHSVTLTELTYSTTYHFRVLSVSTTNSSDAAYSDDSTFRPDRIISGITATVVNSISVTITWTSSDGGTSEIEYGTTSSYGSSISDGNGSSHSVNLTDLSSSTTYHYRIKLISATNSSDVSYSLDRTFNTSASEISTVTVSVISSTSVTITWTTSSSGTSVVDYGTASSYGSTATGTSGTSHSVTLTDLSSTTTYHFRARSVLSSSTYYSSDRTFTTNTPEITSVTITVSTSSVVISWSTSSTGTSVVDYGPTSSYGATATGNSNTRSHSVTITGLPTVTTYHFRAKSVLSSSTYFSSDRTFITPGITISGIAVTNVNSNSVTIAWTTSNNGSSSIEYGTTSSYGCTATGTNGTSHSVTLTGLSPATTYHYRVTSISTTTPSDVANSTDTTFTSISAEIFSVTTTVICTSVTIHWLTYATGTFVVEYGTNSSYGNTISIPQPQLNQFTITGLPSATTYHFRIVSSLLNSDHVTYRYAYSADSTFVISALAISSIVVTPVNSITVTVAWNTSMSGTSIVEYGTDESYGSTATGTSGFSHSISLAGLSAVTTYHYRVVSASSTNSSDIAFSDDATFTTGAAEISSVVVTFLGSNSVNIAWTTVRDSTSVIEFGATSAYGSTATGYSHTRSHSVTLTGLSSATTYHFRAMSVTDYYGSYYSEDTTFHTPAIEVSGVIVVPVSSTSVRITWTTSINGTSMVDYGTDTSYGDTVTGASGASHSVTLTGLSSDITYHFLVRSASATNSSDTAYGDDGTFRCGIVLSNVVVVPVSSTSVTITWTTSISGTSVVEYGLTSSYGSTATGSNGTSHSVSLSGLSYNITYHFLVRSVSTTNISDIAYGNDSTFWSGIVISDVKCTISMSFYGITAVVTWTTSISGSTVVEYGLNSSYGSTKTEQKTRTHSVTITGLTSATTYHFRVKSASESSHLDVAYSNDSTFSTPAIVISNDTYSASGPSVHIYWVTSVRGSSVVEYGTTSSYGNISSNPWTTTYHSVMISGLASNTEYHFRIRSVSSTNSSDIAYGIDTTICTDPITILTPTETLLSSTSARIVWYTNFAGTTTIEYGRTTSYGTTTSIDGNSTYHEITLGGLSHNKKYYYRITSVSQSNPSDMAQITGDFTTPVVTMFNLANVTTNYSASISWNTNIAGTTLVEYGTTISYGSNATGDGGTSHSVSITNLLPGTTYYYRVSSVSTTYGSDVDIDTGTFTTRSVNDAGQYSDVGNNITAALQVVTGSFSGALFSPYDVSDYYKINAYYGQQIQVTLTALSGSNCDLTLLNSSGASMRTSINAAGLTDRIDFRADSSGYWYIVITWVSGTGSCTYWCSVDVSAGQDIYDLDVGSSGDSVVSGHLPGICIYDVDELWMDPEGPVRQCKENAPFLINLHKLSYQAGVGYLITLRYSASATTMVQVLSDDVWVNIATLPRTPTNNAGSYSFVLSSEFISDALPSEIGCNIELRFAHALKVGTISAVAYSYTTDFSSSSIVYHNPGIALTSGWTIVDGVANGTSSPMLTVSVPQVTVSYDLTFTYLNASDGMTVEMYTSSGWISIGTLERWSSSATVTLNYLSYYDSDTNAEGTNLLIRINGALYNLTAVTMKPSVAYTHVGGEGDSVYSGLTTKLFGVSVLTSNFAWSDSMTIDGLDVRKVQSSSSAFFFLNAPLSGQSYRIDITYKTSALGSIYQSVNSLKHAKLGTFNNDNAWHTLSIWVLSDSFYDGSAGSLINARFYLLSANGTYISSFTVYVDSDADTLTDHQETVTYRTDPFSVDTDSDGLNDNVEIINGTYPTDSDTDDDGLMDGSEIWSQSWSNDKFYNVTYNANPVISYMLPALANVTGATLVIGITSESMSDIAVYIRMGSGNWTTLLNQSASGSNFYVSYDLLTRGYSYGNFTSSHTWYIQVIDFNDNNIGGEVQYVTIQVSGTTNPNVSDTDGDGILDGEEVELGVDGWSTNPVLTDTDSDGVSDHIEIDGNYTLCQTETDPTLEDTDGDGYNDNIDRYMGDAVINVTLLNYTSLDNYTTSGYTSGHADIFFVITYVEGGVEFATKRLINSTWNQTYDLNWTYDIDIPDDATYVNMIFEAVAENARYDQDAKLDIDNEQGTDTYNVNWTISAASFLGTGTDTGGSYDGYLTVWMSIETTDRSNVIMINGTDGEGNDYGLYTDSHGNIRFNADSQVYVIYVNCTSASDNFVNGMNTIILPRSIALECRLNYTLSNLGNMTSTDLLYGASLYYTNGSMTTSSSHIIVAISTTLNGTRAEDLLEMLTFNSTNARIGNNVTISDGSTLYLLHLPSDVMEAIPSYIDNEGLGKMPDYPSIQGVLSVIEDLLFDCLILLSGVGMLFLLVKMVEVGLKLVCNLSTGAANPFNAIRAAVDEMVDAFNALKNMLKDFVHYLFNTLISPLLDPICDALHGIYFGFKIASEQIKDDLERDGEVAAASITAMQNALFCDAFFVIVCIAIAINVALFMIKGITLGTSFLITTCMTIMAGLVIYNIIGMSAGAYDGDTPQDGTNGAITNWIESIFFRVSPTKADQVVHYLDSFWCVFAAIPSMVVLDATHTLSAGIGLASTLFSIIIGFYAIADHDARLSAVGLVLGIIGALTCFSGGALDELSKELKAMTQITAFISISLIIADLGMTVI